VLPTDVYNILLDTVLATDVNIIIFSGIRQVPTKMADQFGELDLFLAVAKDCGIVFILNQSQQSSSPCFG